MLFFRSHIVTTPARAYARACWPQLRSKTLGCWNEAPAHPGSGRSPGHRQTRHKYGIDIIQPRRMRHSLTCCCWALISLSAKRTRAGGKTAAEKEITSTSGRWGRLSLLWSGGRVFRKAPDLERTSLGAVPKQHRFNACFLCISSAHIYYQLLNTPGHWRRWLVAISMSRLGGLHANLP